MSNKDIFDRVKTSTCDNCIASSDVNPAFYTTFSFIKNSACPLPVTVVVGVFQNNTATNINLSTNKTSINVFTGVVKDVYPTYVTLSYPSLEDEKILYTISYNGILKLEAPSLSDDFLRYAYEMDKLPGLCSKKHSPALGILRSLSEVLSQPYFYEDYDIVLLGSGTFSPPFSIASISILSNFVVANTSIIFPATILSGYLLDPKK